MVLTAANLFYYLADRGFASTGDVVSGDFRVGRLTRRNQVYRVSFRQRTGHIVKQVKKQQASNITTFEAEAHWYWLLRNNPAFAPLSSFLAECRSYDADNRILILDVPRGSEDLERRHRRLGRCPVEAAALLGATLANFHTALPRESRAALGADFPGAVPWVLSWHEVSDPGPDVSPGARELLHIVHDNPAFGRAFDQLRASWRRETLINADMKFAHSILTGEPERIYFVDWEMADFGDSCWDAGAILHEYLNAWLGSMPSGGEPETLVRNAEMPLAAIQPAVRAFWQSYTHGAATGDPAAMLERSVSYAAAWLIQTAFQGLSDAKKITRRAGRMAQLSLNILQSPAEAAHSLLGI